MPGGAAATEKGPPRRTLSINGEQALHGCGGTCSPLDTSVVVPLGKGQVGFTECDLNSEIGILQFPEKA